MDCVSNANAKPIGVIMREVKHSFHNDNICIWRNIKAYHNDGLKIVSEVKNGDRTDVVVMVKTLKSWDAKLRAGNK